MFEYQPPILLAHLFKELANERGIVATSKVVSKLALYSLIALLSFVILKMFETVFPSNISKALGEPA